MKVDVLFTPSELAGAELADRVVVIDVLRATSTMVEALANGAKAIFPVATADDAARLAQSIGRDSVLLCGERKGLPIEGFDLGNAPPEFTAEAVADKALVMTTTNGTRALLAVAERQASAGGAGGAGGGAGAGGRAGGAGGDGPAGILAASFLNLSAVTAHLADGGGAATLVCAGRAGRFALEDAVCAGSLIRALRAADVDVELDDAGAAAVRLAAGKRGLEGMLKATAAGRRLEEIGRGEDLAFCARVDRTTVVPRLRDRKITVE